MEQAGWKIRKVHRIFGRSTRASIKPKYFEDYTALTLCAEGYLNIVPNKFDNIKQREDKEEWYHVVHEEIKALEKNNTQILTDFSKGKKAISNSEQKCFDCEEMYDSVARLSAVGTLLAVINKEELTALQMDVIHVLLHGNLEEEIYTKTPQGFAGRADLVCQLTNKKSEVDKCLYIYIKGNIKAYLVLYVNDMILAG